MVAGAPHSLPGSATTQCAPEDMARLLLHLWFPCGTLLPQPCESLQTQAHSLCVSAAPSGCSGDVWSTLPQ